MEQKMPDVSLSVSLIYELVTLYRTSEYHSTIYMDSIFIRACSLTIVIDSKTLSITAYLCVTLCSAGPFILNSRFKDNFFPIFAPRQEMSFLAEFAPFVPIIICPHLYTLLQAYFVDLGIWKRFWCDAEGG
jgi:hypothetical protein